MSGGGALDASVTLEEVFTVVGARRVPLAPELAGYLVLELAEHADPNGGDIDPRSVFVGDEGTVALVRPRRDLAAGGMGAAGDAETSIRAALGRLLDASGSQTPALAAASKRKNGAGLSALAAEIEAALIPVNRAAARRALARLAREVKRITLGVGRHTLALPSGSPSVRSNLREPISFVAEPTFERRSAVSTFSPEEDPTTARSKIPNELLKTAKTAHWSEMPTSEFVPDPRAPSSSEADVDSLIAQFRVSGGTEQQHARALKAIAELEPTPAPLTGVAVRPASSSPPPSAEPNPRPRESDIEALLAMNSEPPAARGPSARPVVSAAKSNPPRSRQSTSPAPATGSVPHWTERQLATQPSQLKKTRATLPSVSALRPKRSSAWPVVLGLAAIAAGSYAVWRLRPGALARRAPGSGDAVAPPVSEAPPACLGTLVVTDVPPRAEVLLREGQAPVDIPRMPVGARLEFVATAEGYAPKRVVVPGGAPWDPGPDGKPRFEAAVQLDTSRAPGGVNDPWPVGEPGSAVGGEGPPGTVRVVATPRAAEVWMLAGIAPDARIEHLRCDQDIDVLLAGPTTYRSRLRVHPGDFVPDASHDTPAAASPRATRPPPSARIARVSAK
jgi:hypothetical protein